MERAHFHRPGPIEIWAEEKTHPPTPFLSLSHSERSHRWRPQLPRHSCLQFFRTKLSWFLWEFSCSHDFWFLPLSKLLLSRPHIGSSFPWVLKKQHHQFSRGTIPQGTVFLYLVGFWMWDKDIQMEWSFFFTTGQWRSQFPSPSLLVVFLNPRFCGGNGGKRRNWKNTFLAQITVV